MNTNPAVDAERISYSVPAAAEIIGVSPRTIYSYMSSGVLKTIKVGGRRLVRRVDLERLINGHASEAA